MTPSNDSRAPFRVVADRLRERIASGEFEAGSQLPSGKVLAAEYGVAPNTVLAAIRVLRAEDLVTAHQGKGTYVRDGAAERLREQAGPEFRMLAAKLDDMATAMAALEGRVRDLERITAPSRSKRDRS